MDNEFVLETLHRASVLNEFFYQQGTIRKPDELRISMNLDFPNEGARLGACALLSLVWNNSLMFRGVEREPYSRERDIRIKFNDMDIVLRVTPPPGTENKESK